MALFAIGTLLLSSLGAYQVSRPVKTAAPKEKPVAPVATAPAVTHQPPPLDSAHVVYAVIDLPTQEQVNTLFALHRKGVQVQLVTTIAFSGSTGFTVYTVPKGSIKRNGCLLDSVTWYDF